MSDASVLTSLIHHQKKKGKKRKGHTRGSNEGTKSSHRHSTLKRAKVSKTLEGECLRYENRKFYLLVIRARR
jgi:hypothetical protein